MANKVTDSFTDLTDKISPQQVNGVDHSAATVRATGSVTYRSSADRAADTVNVKDHGAKGDGSTNDTVAVNAAIAACQARGGGTVYFPPGWYVLSPDSIVIDNPTQNAPVVLKGDPGFPVVLSFSTAGTNGISITNGAYCGLENLWIQGNASLVNGVSHETPAENALFRNVFVNTAVNGWAVGPMVDGDVSETVFDRCKAEACTNGWALGNLAFAPGNPLNVYFINCDTRNNHYGVRSYTMNFTWSEGTAIGNSVCDFKMDKPANGPYVISGIRGESSKQFVDFCPGYSIPGPSLTIDSCRIVHFTASDGVAVQACGGSVLISNSCFYNGPVPASLHFGFDPAHPVAVTLVSVVTDNTTPIYNPGPHCLLRVVGLFYWDGTAISALDDQIGTLAGVVTAPGFALSDANDASSFKTRLLGGRNVPVIDADGGTNVVVLDQYGIAINGSTRPALLGGAAITATPIDVSYPAGVFNGNVVVQGTSTQPNPLQQWKIDGTALHNIGPDGRTYWGNNDLGGTFNVFAGGSRSLAVFQWQEAFGGGAVVASYVGNPVTGVVYGYLASGVVSDRFFNRIQNTGDGSAVFDAAVYGAGSAYTAYGKNGGSAWCSGYHQADGDSYKIGAYGVIGYDTVLKITPTGGTSLSALADGTVPLTIFGALGSESDVQEWKNGVGSLMSGVTYNGIIYYGVASGDFGVGIECGATNAAIQAKGGGNPQVRANSTDGVIAKMQAIGNLFGLVGTESNHPFKLYVNQNPAVYIDTNGYVCVGNAVPGAKLDVYDATLTNLQARILNDKTDSTSNTAELVFGSRSGSLLIDRAKISARSSNTGNYRTEMDFQTIDAGTGVWTSRMLIDSDGHAGFSGAVKLAALADASAPNGSMFKSTDRSNKACFKDDAGVVHELY